MCPSLVGAVLAPLTVFSVALADGMLRSFAEARCWGRIVQPSPPPCSLSAKGRLKPYSSLLLYLFTKPKKLL